MKIFLHIICSFVFISSVFSQEPPKNNTEVDRVIDALFTDDEQTINELMEAFNNYQMLYVSLNYNSNSYFAGRDIGFNQFNLVPQIAYLHSSGIFGSISANYYEKFDPKIDVTTLTAGYGKNFGKHKNFRYSGYYSKYFYANNEDNFLDNAVVVSLNAKSLNKKNGTSFSVGYLFGNKDAIQLTSSSFATIKVYKSNKLSVDIKPQISITAGKQTIELSRISIEQGFPQILFYSDNIFDLINTQLNFPVQFSVDSFDFELGYYVNFPKAIGNETDLKNTSFFNISVGYLISL